MATNVIMPHMGITTTEGTVVRWIRSEGEAVSKGDPLVEVLTDKVTLEIESPCEGVLLKIVAPEGAVVPVTEVLCWVGQLGDDLGEDGRAEEAARETLELSVVSAPERVGAPVSGGYVRASPIARRLAREHGIELALVTPGGPEGRVVEADILNFIKQREDADAVTAVKASPVARRLAKERGVDLSAVQGTGPLGRIMREDVAAAAQQVVAEQAAPAQQPAALIQQASLSGVQVTSRIPLAGLRRTIAQRMSQSSQMVARVTHTTEVDLTETVRMREHLAAESERLHGIRVSYTDIIVKIVTLALRQHPLMNARLAGEDIELLQQVNVGVAVAVPQGLVVPVIHDADEKSLVTIARETREKAERARMGTLTLDDLTGGTFTVTNLGTYGIDAFTPIVNLPEVGILGVGRVVEKPLVFKGEIAKRATMFLSLSFDHRVLDGVPAAEFLRTVSQCLENPYAMFL